MVAVAPQRRASLLSNDAVAVDGVANTVDYQHALAAHRLSGPSLEPVKNILFFRDFLIRTHVVALADFQTVVTQDRVAGCDMEEKLRQTVVR